ncbi:MAG: class I tRNA ligase family protein, partial [Candidatus Parcubacteria bacterium]|nr:class I tRNA ligase family protein [Candidatus Parcubacteria bacterium]
MSEKYDHQAIEKKWQKAWEEQDLFKAPTSATRKDKFYILPQFPYPSGDGLHVGHAEVYAACDIYARYQRLIGKKVLQVAGWDAFGLPAENYAIKTNVHPRVSTDQAIESFKTQVKRLGIAIDWDREISTHNPDYYKWTQWFFLLFYKRGLAYRKKQAVNWCDSCKTVLANEQVTTDGHCERCGTLVEQREMEEWYLKITDYAERLLNDLDKVDWPEESKKRQRDWIGKSKGAEIEFIVKSDKLVLLDKPVNPPMNWWVNQKADEKTFFVTFPTYKRTPFFEENKEAEVILSLFKKVINEKKYQVLELVVMPEHVHLLVKRGAKDDLEEIIKNLKGISSRLYEKSEVRLWAKSFEHEEVLSEESLKRIFSYIQNNPDKNGLTKNGRLWSLLNDSLSPKITIKVFTTRPDTLFGATYLVLAPEHDWSTRQFIGGLTNSKEVTEYINATKLKTDLDRQIEKEKTGVELQGVKAINPATGKGIPIFIADYVLSSYGTGAIMAVPAHDKRDFEFAQEYDLPIKCVIKPRNLKEMISAKIVRNDLGEKVIAGKALAYWPDHESAPKAFDDDLKKILKGEMCYVGFGELVNSNEFNGLASEEAKQKITEKVGGKLVTRYKLRDWSVSRQRFWGAPIPMMHNKEKSKKYNYVILHGYSGTGDQNGPARGDSVNWRKGLRLKLEQEGRTVYCPDLPNTEEPNIEEQVDFVLKNTVIDKNTVLVSHSLGSVVIFKLLEKLNKKVAMILLVDPVVRPDFADRQRPMVAKSCGWKFDWKKIKKLSDEFIILGDKEFGTIFEKDLRDLAQQLDSNLILVKPEAGHFTAANEPTIDALLERVGWMAVPEKDLPVILPDDVDFKPTGESPLNYSPSFNNGVEEKYGQGWKREPDTLDTFMCSSWYYYRHLDPHNNKEFASPKALKTWMPVDFYLGGPEHVNGHLLYSRFFTKVLFDAGYIDFDEPFLKHRHQGLILGEDNRKMSKRWGNSINPNAVADEYGADTLRIYEMFMG